MAHTDACTVYLRNWPASYAADPCLTEGFHAFEPDEGIRWTNGDAMLPTTLFEGFRGRFELELQPGGAMRYLDIGG